MICYEANHVGDSGVNKANLTRHVSEEHKELQSIYRSRRIGFSNKRGSLSTDFLKLTFSFEYNGPDIQKEKQFVLRKLSKLLFISITR